jgi:hypothetical protein
MTTTTALVFLSIISIIFIAGFYLIDIFDESLLPASLSSASTHFKENDGDIKTENNNFKQTTLSDNFTDASEINKSIQECSQTNDGKSSIVGVNASSFVPPNKAEKAVDSNLNTVWAALGKGSWIELDLGCEKIISTLEIAWNESDKRKDAYTIEVLSEDRKNIVDKFNYTSEVLPLDIAFQSSGINNTKGRYVRILIDDDNSVIKQYASIREISVYVVPPLPGDFYKVNKERWNESFPYYPHILAITNSSGTMVDVPLTTISDGDSDPIRNPNYRLPRDPVINLKAGEPFEVSINWDHIEGIGASMILAVNENRNNVTGSSRNTYNDDDGGQMLTINSLNDTNAIYEGKYPKHYAFVPQIKNNSTVTPTMIATETYTLTIFVAIADDTSIDFQTKVFLSS